MGSRHFGILFVAIVLLAASSALAQTGGGQGGSQDGSGANAGNDNSVAPPNAIQTRETTQERDQDRDQERDQAQTGAGNGEPARVQTQSTQQVQTQQREGSTVNEQQVRNAVQNMLELRERAGNIGTNISRFAQQVNQSQAIMNQARIQIETRSTILRIFAGGDRESAQKLEQERERNQEQLRTMTQLVEGCNCTNQTQEQLREELRVIEQNQEQLRALAQRELQSKGLFGWIWK